MAKRIWIGSLLLFVILTSSFYILMPGKVRIDFQETRTIFRVWEEDNFVISGIEYTKIFDGSKLMRAKNRSISYDIKKNITKWYRIANFKDNIIVEDFVEFENEATDVENVPIDHKICFTNAKGKIFEYLVSDITYDGDTKSITSPFSFGKNMKVSFQDGYHIAKVVNNKIAKDKIIVRYRVTEDNECFDVRLFDPEIILKEEEPVITWKDNCQTRCIDGKCNNILGKTIWVNDSYGTCQPIEKAKSLKNGFYIEYLEIDPSFNLTVNDFNISYMNMTLEFVGNPADYPTFCQITDELNAKCDFKLDEKWNEYDEEGNVTEKKQLKFQYKWEIKQGEIIKGDKVKYEYKENVMGKKFSFGGNSTTIQLQDANTENLEDTYIAENAPITNYGANNYLYAGEDSVTDKQRLSYLKFNITPIPEGQTIIDSKLCLFVTTNLYDTGETATAWVYELDNQIWVETNPTWNKKVTGVGSLINTIGGIDGDWDDFWLCFNGTDWVSSEYSDGKSNVSFMVNATLEYDVSDAFRFYSKEYTFDIPSRPYLNITYSEAVEEDTIPPTYSDNSTNTTYAGEDTLFSLKWTDETELATLGGYIFSTDNGTEIFVNDSWIAFSSNPDWSNVTKTVNSTVGATIRWCVYANDTSNNWNSTSCVSPFSYVTTSAGAPDINHTIWDGSNWIQYGVGEYPRFRCTPTQTNCEPTNQDAGSSQSIFKICNNGTVAGTSVYMNVNTTFTGIDLKCDDDYTTADATVLTTANQTIHEALVVDACIDVSCWADYNNPISGGYFGIIGYVI